ncbi:MAG: hypothetical protein ACPGU4_09995 [Flavobacteriales bacterium]
MNPKIRKSIQVNSKYALVIVSFIFICCQAIAQDVPARLDAFNEAVGKQYRAYHKGKTLMIEGFREGKQVKLDKIHVHDLDVETAKFSEEDQSVSVKCFSDLDGCVNRVLLLNKKKSYKKRLVFGIDEGIDGVEVLAKLKMLLNEMAKK